MSFNKYLVPAPADMIKVLENGVARFFNRNIDAMIGNSTSLRMIDDAHTMLTADFEEPQIIERLKELYADELN